MIDQKDTRMVSGPVDSIKNSDDEIPDDAFQLRLKSYQVLKRAENKKLDLFESRGSAMLKAALSDKNRQENNPFKKQKDPVISRMIELERAHIQQANSASSLKNNKKRLRNNVIFREPVVSQEYSYEPTQLPEPVVTTNNEITYVEPTIERRIFSDRKINFNNNVQITYSNPNKLFLSAFDEDDDEGVFVSDSSSGKTDEEIVVRKPVKRPYESIDESQSKSHQQLTQGLFSSPKVAKIAPYFEEKPRDKSNLETREASSTKNCPHPYKSRSIPSKIYQVRNKQKDFMKKKSIEDSTCLESNSRLISYRRNCNNITEIDTDMKSKQEPNQNSAFWPFNWLSSGYSFISNQVDKLIFQ